MGKVKAMMNEAKRPVREGAGDLVMEAQRTKADRDRDVSEIRYRRLFESAKDGILILDAQTGQIEDANPFMSELLGYPREQFLGKQLWEIGLFQDIEESKAAFRELQGKGYIRYEDLPLESKDGQRRDVEFISNAYPVGDRMSIQCNIRDITDASGWSGNCRSKRNNLPTRTVRRTNSWRCSRMNSAIPWPPS